MKKLTEQLAFTVMFLALLVVIMPIVLAFYFIISRGMPALSWRFLTEMPRLGMRAGGIFPAIIGTFYLTLGTILISLPLGIVAAIYLTEYARPGRLIRLTRLAIVNLAGVPSIVYGLFGLGAFVLFLKFGSSILAGSLTLALLVLPFIIIASEEALKVVPQSFREASLALGASKWQTVRKVVLPAAIPGMLTGAILAIGRAAGETAPILFTVAAFYLPRLPRSIFDQVMALPYHLYVVSTQIPNSPQKIQYGTALVLLILVFMVNLGAFWLRFRLRKRQRW